MMDLTQIYLRYKEEHDTAINRVVQSGRYIQGDEVNIFASEMSRYLLPRTNKNIVCTCANGSDALMIAYQALGIKAGDEVIMPSHNYVASAESAIRLGITPVLADTDSDYQYRFAINSDHNYLDSITTKKTKAIVMVNMYGLPCNTDRLRSFCRQKGIILIEDNAQGFGGEAKTSQGIKKMSLHGDISTTSFFPTKPLGCMGDGGAIISDNEDWINISNQISKHGQKSKYQYECIGMNSRLDALQAAILRVRLSKIDEIINSYNDVAKIYDLMLQSPYIQKPVLPDDCRPTFYQYTIVLDRALDRKKLMDRLATNGLQTSIYYPEPLSDIHCYKKICVTRCNLKNTNDIKNRILSLPIYPFMAIKDAERNAEIFLDTCKSIL